ncbi:3-hydroxybutyryl-CoA dehydratase [Ophiocordyceps sinensis CO18]|uniref:3-hydroxybutyryl-CoA dehydratase n=1 Tax=Ophiocordyceps sinensis (strain Co18 / CGMCC 3.14243) TaxID=911162 RepID=T5A9T3_OPHSC|nr:3-hydroxybutyryl-CoA dehydratase [Ophiocordyceps sinensis CO18]
MSRPAVCRTIIGRGLFLFEKASGQGYDYVRWRALSPAQKNFLLAQSAQAPARLFEYWLPAEYAWTWLPVRLAELQQRQASRDVAPTRDFCEYMMHARIDFALARFAPRALDLFSRVATVRGILHWLVPRVLPHAGNGLSEAALYRLVLDHGDFGMHNMTIATDKRGWPWITSVYDWEGASIVPAVLSEPKMVVTADLVLDDEGEPTVSRWGDGDSLPRMDEYLGWSREYYRELFRQSPEYQRVIEASKDARIIWFAMRGLETAEPGALFSRLYEWAKQQTTG